MSLPGRLGLAARLLAREWRAGELRILLIALVVAVASSTAIDFFTARISQGMQRQSAGFLGADLILVSPNPADSRWLAEAERRGLTRSEALEFASMTVAGERFQLAGIKAVSPPYPLRGHLRVAKQPFSEGVETTALPNPGEAWLDPRLFGRLGLEPGGTLEIGDQRFIASRVLDFEPGLRMDLLGIAPRVLIHQDDVAGTGVVQPGSRLAWHYLFSGSPGQVEKFRGWLEGRLQSTQQLIGVRQGRRMVGAALERAETYLGLAGLVALVLAGVAIAMAAGRHSRRHFDSSALMRCMGASEKDLLWLHLPQLLILGLIGSGLGVAIGWSAHWGLLWLLADLLPPGPLPLSWRPAASGMATGLVVLIGFALPPMLRLRAVPPLRVLRRDILPRPPAAWLAHILAFAAILLLMRRHSADWQLIFILLGGAAAMLLLLWLLSLILLALGRQMERFTSASWRLGLNSLWRRRNASLGQILAFGLVLMAMASMTLVRTDLLASWRSQLPADAPNHFLINILPERVTALHRFLQQHGIAAARLYPLVRGRLSRLNERPIATAVPRQARNHNALHRELNLSWSGRLPPDNRITSGRWFSADDQGRSLVSVEEGMARELGLEVGDRLVFTIGGEVLETRVHSLRKVQWDSFRPNFYVLFPPGVLEGFPATWMTSFHLPPQDQETVQALVQTFPATTLLELELIMRQVQRILGQLTRAVEYVLLFVLAAGMVVLFAALQATLDERLYEGALLRALGARSSQLRNAHLAEFLTLGFMAGLLAALGAETLIGFLYSRLLALEPGFHPALWLFVPLASTLLVGLAGYLGTRQVLRESPLKVFRQLQ